MMKIQNIKANYPVLSVNIIDEESKFSVEILVSELIKDYPCYKKLQDNNLFNLAKFTTDRIFWDDDHDIHLDQVLKYMNFHNAVNYIKAKTAIIDILAIQKIKNDNQRLGQGHIVYLITRFIRVVKNRNIIFAISNNLETLQFDFKDFAYSVFGIIRAIIEQCADLLILLEDFNTVKHDIDIILSFEDDFKNHLNNTLCKYASDANLGDILSREVKEYMRDKNIKFKNKNVLSCITNSRCTISSHIEKMDDILRKHNNFFNDLNFKESWENLSGFIHCDILNSLKFNLEDNMCAYIAESYLYISDIDRLVNFITNRINEYIEYNQKFI